MIRKCHWCGKKYDASKESSVWCAKNPHRSRGASRIPPKIVRLLVLPR